MRWEDKPAGRMNIREESDEDLARILSAYLSDDHVKWQQDLWWESYAENKRRNEAREEIFKYLF